MLETFSSSAPAMLEINFKNTITNNPEFGYKFVGFLDNGKSDPEIIGRIDELVAKLNQNKLMKLLLLCRMNPHSILMRISGYVILMRLRFI